MDPTTPSALPLLSSLTSTFFILLAFSSSPLLRSLSLLDLDLALPDGSISTIGVGLWGGCIKDGPCTFQSPFATSHPPNPLQTHSPQYLSTLLPSRYHTLALFSLLLLAFLASSFQHLLNSYLLFGQLSQTPRTFRRGQSRAKKWSRDAGYLGGAAAFVACLILGFSLLYPYGVLIREFLDPDRLGGREMEGGRLLTPGIGTFLVLGSGCLMVFGGRFSWRSSTPSVALSKDLDDEEEIESPTTTTTASFIVLTEQRAEKPWIVLDVVVEEDEFDEIAIEDRRTTTPTKYTPIRSSHTRSKTPSLFYLA
ncbi:hypothetical protein BDY24DRAFT_417685 [Mrakia frigida]|uniref:uncharacterized protein n=1 Tax=Mrakia frigida TaxID=29902 RepID=UPI003FCC131A